MGSGGATSPIVRTLTSVGLVAVVGAIVLGILGMHGFSQHGAAPGVTANSSAATTSDTALHTGHAGMEHAPGGLSVDVADASDTAPAAEGSVVSSGDQDGSAGHMATLCAAMLLAAASGVLLMLFLRGAARRVEQRVRTLMPALTRLVSTRLGTGPPSVWEFSVVRC